MAHIDIFLDKFSETGKPILQEALKMAKAGEQKHLSEAHVVIAFHSLNPQMFDLGVSQTRLTAAQVLAGAEQAIAELNGFQKNGVKIHRSATDLFKRAMRIAQQKERRRIDALDLLAAINFAPPETDLDVRDEMQPFLIVSVKYIWRRLFSSRLRKLIA